MLSLIDLIQSIDNNSSLNEENVQKILSLEAFREHPELRPVHLQQLVELCCDPQKKLAVVISIINYVSNETTRFTDLVDSTLLIQFASLDIILAEYIFSNDFCLDVFRKNVDSFPNYFLHLCENQTLFSYTLLRRHADKHNELIDSLKKCHGHRSLCSQILSYCDNIPHKEIDSGITSYVYDNFAQEFDLIRGDDAKNNLLLIARSKTRAHHLLQNILINKITVDRFPDISYVDMIDVVKIHNDLCYLIINHLLVKIDEVTANGSGFTQLTESLNLIQELLPLLESSVNKENEPLSKLALAKLLFRGITSEGQQTDNALSLCTEIFESHDKGRYHIEACRLLLQFADAYSYGAEYVEKTIQKYSKQAIALYQFLANKASDKGIQSEAGNILTSTEFILSLDGSCDAEYLFAKYMQAKRTEKPILSNYRGLRDYNDRRMIQYYNDNLYYPTLKDRLANLVGNILAADIVNPSIFLKIAKKCTENKLESNAVKLLLSIGKNNKGVSSSLCSEYAKISYELAVKLISQGDFNQAISLLRCVPKNSFDYACSQKFLQFADITLLTQSDLQESQTLSRIEIIQILQYYYEDAYHAANESLRLEAEIDNGYHSNCAESIQSCKNLLVDLEKLLLNLQQELVSLQHPTLNIPKLWNGNLRQALPEALKREIISTPTLRDASLKTVDFMQYSAKGLQKFGLNAQNKFPATRWTKTDNDDWQKVTDIDMTDHLKSAKK
jgi:hypothetical protein